jgi:toxin ParE1/3/4
MPPLKLQLSTLAEQDIEDILAHSEAEFGESARLRYEALLDAALRALLANPKGPGVRSREELGPGICSYHLRFARDRVRRGRVRTPRHFLIFKVVASVTLQVGRILHDAMELAAHLPPDSFPPLNER